MRIAFVTDVHLGATAEGFQQQPRWIEGTGQLLEQLHQQAVSLGVDLLVYGGDLVEHGTSDQINHAVALLSGIPLPALVCLGNHDLSERASYPFWRRAMWNWPQAALADKLLEFPDCDLCALNTHWMSSSGPALFWDYQEPVPCLIPEQLTRLDAWLGRRHDRPAIVAMHAQLDALPSELTGAAQPLHASPPQYVDACREVLQRHPRAQLVLAGHCHATHAGRHGHRIDFSGSSLTEVPYQFFLIEVRNGRIGLETHTLAVSSVRGPAFNQGKAWVMGREEDRTVDIRPIKAT